MSHKLLKLSPLLAVAALIACVVVSVLYVQSQSDKESIDAEIAFTEEALADYYNDLDDLEEQLATAGTRLASEKLLMDKAVSEARQMYSVDMTDNAYVLQTIIQAAKDNELVVTDINAQPSSEDETGNITYSTLSLDLGVEGELENISDFVKELETGEINAVSIDSISVAEAGIIHRARIDLRITYICG